MPTFEQPGRTLVEDRSGKKTLTITFVGNEIATAPSVANSSLVSTTVVTAEAGTVRTTFQYDQTQTGSVIDPSSGISNIVGIEFVGSLRTVPIQAHPNFSEPHLNIDDHQKIKKGLETSSEFSPTFDDTSDPARCVSLYGYLIKGIESYYEPSIIIRKTFFSSSLPSGDKLGKIKDPNVFYGAEPDNASYLLISVSARGQAGAYTITEEYELSGEGGWDTFLYGP